MYFSTRPNCRGGMSSMEPHVQLMTCHTVIVKRGLIKIHNFGYSHVLFRRVFDSVVGMECPKCVKMGGKVSDHIWVR